MDVRLCVNIHGENKIELYARFFGGVLALHFVPTRCPSIAKPE